jgi:GntR family transcriptional regulator, transcriptional repressor for pyruvate dehydrogenase complex
MSDPIRLPRTFELISERILGQLASGELRLGDRLPNERELARDMEVSRHAVREALRSLESKGLVQLKKGAKGGAFVANRGAEVAADVMRGMLMVGGISLEQLTEARLGIEAMVVRSASACADAAAIGVLEDNIKRAEAETRAGNLEKKTRLNIEFHALLAAATKNPVLELVMASILGVVERFAVQIGSVMDLDVIASRRRLLDHLRVRDADAAVAEMNRHLRVLHGHYLAAASERGQQAGRAKPRDKKPGRSRQASKGS